MKLTDYGKLSEYFGKKTVVLAFYPAAFSMSCGAEVTRFDTFAQEQFLEKVTNSQMAGSNDFEILMISQSNTQILEKWRNEMDIKNIKLVNDFSGEISMKYSSYNPLGYNRRTIFLIDKDGKVSYIDWDYKVDDEDFTLIKERLISMND
jgi:peroxiredoxin